MGIYGYGLTIGGVQVSGSNEPCLSKVSLNLLSVGIKPPQASLGVLNVEHHISMLQNVEELCTITL